MDQCCKQGRFYSDPTRKTGSGSELLEKTRSGSELFLTYGIEFGSDLFPNTDPDPTKTPGSASLVSYPKSGQTKLPSLRGVFREKLGGGVKNRFFLQYVVPSPRLPKCIQFRYLHLGIFSPGNLSVLF